MRLCNFGEIAEKKQTYEGMYTFFAHDKLEIFDGKAAEPRTPISVSLGLASFASSGEGRSPETPPGRGSSFQNKRDLALILSYFFLL